MVDLDHCSYATIWACDKDCNRGNICHLLLVFAFFSLLLFIDTVISTLLSSSLCSYLDSDPVFSLSPSSTFHHFPTHPSSVRLISAIPPSLCTGSGAAWLSLPPCWAGACLKGPRTPHTLRVSSHARDALSPLLPVSSPLTSSHSYQLIWSLFIFQGQKKRSNTFFIALHDIQIRNISVFGQICCLSFVCFKMEQYVRKHSQPSNYSKQKL